MEIDDATLALLYLILYDHCCVWKEIDWEITNRLHEKGLFIPMGKTKSVVLTDEGLSSPKNSFTRCFRSLK